MQCAPSTETHLYLPPQVPDRAGGQENSGKVRERGKGEEQGDLVPGLGTGHQPGGEKQGLVINLYLVFCFAIPVDMLNRHRAGQKVYIV